MTSFDFLGLSDHLLRGVQAQGYDAPTPIQLRAIPQIIAGVDLVAGAKTRNKKTVEYWILHLYHTVIPVPVIHYVCSIPYLLSTATCPNACVL